MPTGLRPVSFLRHLPLPVPNPLRIRSDTLGAVIASPQGVNPKALALQQRTHNFFVRIIRFCEELPDDDAVRSIRSQLLDSAGSTDSNYRGACKARTKKELISKVGIAAEEADESCGWLAALLAAGYGDRSENRTLIQESDELTRILVASHKTATARQAAAEAAAKGRRRRR